MCTERKATGLFVLASFLFAIMSAIDLIGTLPEDEVLLPCLPSRLSPMGFRQPL